MLKFYDFCTIQIYVKSTLENLKVLKMPFLLFLGALNLVDSKNAEIHKILNLEFLSVLKLQILAF